MLVLTKRKTREKTQILRQNLRLVTRREQEQEQEQDQSHQTKKLGRFRRKPLRKVRWWSPRAWERNCWRRRSQPGTS